MKNTLVTYCELFFASQFKDEDDDEAEGDKQSPGFFDDANGNLEDKEPNDNLSGNPLASICDEQDRSDNLNRSLVYRSLSINSISH